jgi:hypothetical protein
MRKRVVILMSFVILLLSPNLILAECLDLGGFTSFYMHGVHIITFYKDENTIGHANIRFCIVRDSSSIRLIQNYVCDGDYIMVDGEKCRMELVSPEPLDEY